MKFRKKPVAIESRGPLTVSEVVVTAHGPIHADRGDYVLRDPQSGDTWPIKPEIFEATYEPDDRPRFDAAKCILCGEPAVEVMLYNDGCECLHQKIQPRCAQHVNKAPNGEAAASLDRVVEFANNKIAALADFKKNTHILLDETGVDRFEKEECRVSARIRALAAQRDRVRAINAELLAALCAVSVDGPLSETPTIESILNRAQRIAREAVAKVPNGVAVGPKSAGADLIAAERRRQVEVDGWTAEHDDNHFEGHLAMAGACYAAGVPIFIMHQATVGGDGRLPMVQFSNAWPWGPSSYKPVPNDRVRELVKAGALIAAEIDRLEREKKGVGD